MKKLFILCSLVLCLLLGSASVLAADTTDNENTSTKITVSFKTGTTSYTVNGKNVKAEASALIQGKTFVPVKVISDALNATFTVDLKTKTATINYNGVVIKLTDKKKEAIIAGKKVSIDAAPYIKNSNFMASITFLADTLGADITNTNGQVTFVKEIANPNSIKDFGTLIKKTTKDKIGDSYYKWSMLLPDDLKLEYRDFNGTDNYFHAIDKSYIVDVYIYDINEDASLDNSTNYMLNYTKDYTLIDYGTKTNNEGIDYVEFIYKDDEQTYQDRTYLIDNKEYNFIIITLNDDSYLDDKYQNIADSFQFNFNKDGSTEDLSDVSSTGYRKYQDTKLIWSINMHPDWEEIKDKKIQNKVLFSGENKSYFTVEVYSLDKGETLDSITQESIHEIKENYNTNLFTVTKQESAVIGGIKCNKMYYNFRKLNNITYGCEVYFIDKNYKYVLCSELSEKDYKDSKQKDISEGIINSFSFKELNTKTIGKLLDPDKVILAKKTRNVSTDLFSMDIPFNWTESTESKDDLKSYYLDSASVAVSVLDGYSLYDFINFTDDYYGKKVGKDLRIESKTSITEKNTTCYKYVIIYTEDGSEYREEVYIIQKGNKIFSLYCIVDNFRYGTKISTTFNDIWQSFTLK